VVHDFSKKQNSIIDQDLKNPSATFTMKPQHCKNFNSVNT